MFCCGLGHCACMWLSFLVGPNCQASGFLGLVMWCSLGPFLHFFVLVSPLWSCWRRVLLVRHGILDISLTFLLFFSLSSSLPFLSFLLFFSLFSFLPSLPLPLPFFSSFYFLSFLFFLSLSLPPSFSFPPSLPPSFFFLPFLSLSLSFLSYPPFYLGCIFMMCGTYISLFRCTKISSSYYLLFMFLSC